MYGKNKHKKTRGRYKLSKFTVWCVRVSQKERCMDNEFVSNLAAGPCIICRERLKLLGFGKIAFSNEIGEIEIHKLKDYKKIHITNNHKRFLGDDKLTTVKAITRGLKCVKLI